MVSFKLLGLIAFVSLTILGTIHYSNNHNISEDLQPPVWPNAFEQSFDQTFIVNNKTQIVNGMLYYDATHNRSRLDRANGAFDMFCGSLQPNLTTACVSLVTQGKRYIYFPNKKQCCICCDAEHGCGILKPDWLSGAQYLGEDKLDDHTFQKWNKEGVFGYNYYWNTHDDNKIPRKIDEGGNHIFNFNIYSYKKRQQNERLFDVPDYCKKNCPATSMCGKHQNSELKRQNRFMI